MKEEQKNLITLKRLFISIFIVVGIIPLVLFGILSFVTVEKSIYNNQINAMHQISSMATDNIDRWADDNIILVEELANSQILATNDIEKIREDLKLKVAQDTCMKNIMYVDTQGNVIADGIGSINKNIKDTVYFSQAQKAYTSISDVLTEEDGIPTINFAAPVKMSGKLQGYIINQVEMSKIEKIIGKVTFSKGSRIFAFNNRGEVTWQAKQDTRTYPNVLDEGNKTLSEAAANALKGNQSHAVVELDGVKHIIVYHFIAALGWGTMTIIPFTEFYSGIIEVIKVVIPIALAIVVMVILLLRWADIKIVRPIMRLAHLTMQVAEGDLSLQTEVSKIAEIGEIGMAFNKMIQSLKMMINKITDKNSDLKEAVEQLNQVSSVTESASEEIKMAMLEIAEGATLQANKTDYVLENTKELNDKAKQAASQVDGIHICLADLKECVQQAEEKADQLQQSTNVQKELVYSTTGEVQSLEKSVSNIHDIIHAIYGITDQTHLLALNATIEAARAGESGQGFAVVAQEIGKLAIESRTATESIAGILEEIVHQTKITTETMQKIVAAMENQSQDVLHTHQAFKAIEEKEVFIHENMNEFEKVIKYMGTFSEDLMKVVDELVQIAANSAAVTEETTAATQEQMSMIENLNQSTKNIEGNIKELQQSIEHFETKKVEA